MSITDLLIKKLIGENIFVGSIMSKTDWISKNKDNLFVGQKLMKMTTTELFIGKTRDIGHSLNIDKNSKIFKT